MSEDFRYFIFCYSVLFCRFKMILKRRIGQSLCHKRNNSYYRTIPERKKVISTPHFSEKNVVIETRKLGCKIAECIMPDRLLDFNL